jgi:HSP20 family protein
MAKTESKSVAEKKEKGLSSVRPRGLFSFDDMEKMFENFFHSNWMRPSWGNLPQPFEGKVPSVDIVERDDEILVRAEVPGVNKEDLDVSMTDDSITIKGKTRHEEKEEKGDYYRCEISSGSFSRTLPLPSSVNTEKAKTSFKDGLLEITVPKNEKAKRRTIKVD